MLTSFEGDRVLGGIEPGWRVACECRDVRLLLVTTVGRCWYTRLCCFCCCWWLGMIRDEREMLADGGGWARDWRELLALGE